jgi:hypothetical protein
VREAAGAAGIRHSLRPPIFGRATRYITRAQSRRGNVELRLIVIASEAKQSNSPQAEIWIASSRSLSSGRPKGRTRWLLAMTTLFENQAQNRRVGQAKRAHHS